MVWQDYNVGDPIPQNAVQVSVWRDGTPLYGVDFFHNGGYYIGYYLPTIRKVYIMAGEVFSPTIVEMLVRNWLCAKYNVVDSDIYNDSGVT